MSQLSRKLLSSLTEGRALLQSLHAIHHHDTRPHHGFLVSVTRTSVLPPVLTDILRPDSLAAMATLYILEYHKRHNQIPSVSHAAGQPYYVLPINNSPPTFIHPPPNPITIDPVPSPNNAIYSVSSHEKNPSARGKPLPRASLGSLTTKIASRQESKWRISRAAEATTRRDASTNTQHLQQASSVTGESRIPVPVDPRSPRESLQ